MKKNTLKAFTLVEMLIVIVIIGILIAALLPRMQAAQGRARDVARKTALSQVQSAIVTYQGDHGKWPGIDSGAANGIGLSVIEKELISAGMTNVPKDPLADNQMSGLKSGETISGGDYGYIVMTRNGTANAGFALMAKTEVAGGSNYVICSGDTLASSVSDLKSISLCAAVNEADACDASSCEFANSSELRYVVVF